VPFLLMGVANVSAIFQSKIPQLMVGLDFVTAYLNNVLVPKRVLTTIVF
jgi:hypothetical protein